MSIAILSLFRLFKTTPQTNFTSQAWNTQTRVSPLSLTPTWRHKPQVSPKKAMPPLSLVAKKPLRVSRILEAQAGKHTTGRMVISGSMKDVCAELDRLVMLENSTLTH